MNREEWNNTASEQNAKAEQLGAALGCLWFVAVFLCIPIIILFPPSFFIFVGIAVWVVYRMQQTKQKR